jgi:hypothetical protein
MKKIIFLVVKLFLFTTTSFTVTAVTPEVSLGRSVYDILEHYDIYEEDSLIDFNYLGINNTCNFSSFGTSFIPGSANVEDNNGEEIQISVLTEWEVQEYFNLMKSQSHIPFSYPEDGCYARAQEMSLLLEQYGVVTGKVFIEGDLRVETNNSPKGFVEWWYHVAPIVLVDTGEKVEQYVLDPSLFDRAVPLEVWTNTQTAHNPGQQSEVYITKRFNFTPIDKNEDFVDYDIENLRIGSQRMQEYMSIINKRNHKKILR